MTLQASAYVEFVSVPSAGVNYVAKSRVDVGRHH